MGKKIFLGIVGLLALLGGSLGGYVWWKNEPLPQGTSGPHADALARKVQAAMGMDAWQKTGAVAWTFWGRNKHVWDRERWLSQVSWGDTTVQFVIYDHSKSIVTKGGAKVEGAAATAAVKKAYAEWCNDSFWLLSTEKFFDKSVTRKVVESQGKKHLLIQYASGGVTPGDSYLYLLDDTGLPLAWKMWVSIIPVGGFSAKYLKHTILSTGARVYTNFDLGLAELILSDVKGATTIQALFGKDIFADLAKSL